MAKSRLAARLESRRETLVDLCRSFVRIDSRNPPGDTTAFVEAVEAVLDSAAGIEHRRVVGRAPVVNLVARTRGASPGRRLVLNGHLDTFPIGETLWQHRPLGADLEDGRIDGRGACDMKAGVAALMLAFVTLAELRDAWNGEVVLTLVGDEETGGVWGTQYLLANVEEAVGDAMLNADTGSPRVVRVGEKGNVWVELEATGVANHAAHVHLGRNAVDALADALGAVRALAALPPSVPAAVERTIAEAKAVSEVDSGEGEAETLRRITVNIGRIEGGIGVNTIPDRTRHRCASPPTSPVLPCSLRCRLQIALARPRNVHARTNNDHTDTRPTTQIDRLFHLSFAPIVVDRAGPANAEPIARSIVSSTELRGGSLPRCPITAAPAPASSASTPNACRSKRPFATSKATASGSLCAMLERNAPSDSRRCCSSLRWLRSSCGCLVSPLPTGNGPGTFRPTPNGAAPFSRRCSSVNNCGATIGSKPQSRSCSTP